LTFVLPSFFRNVCIKFLSMRSDETLKRTNINEGVFRFADLFLSKFVILFCFGCDTVDAGFSVNHVRQEACLATAETVGQRFFVKFIFMNVL